MHKSIVLLLCVACGSPRPAKDGVEQKETPPLEKVDLDSPHDARQATLHAPDADTVFIGRLVEAGPPPGFWSGYNVATQSLTYDVVRVLKGKLPADRVTVQQLIVATTPPVKDEPALKDDYTQVGKEYVVLLAPHPSGTLTTMSEMFGPAPATPELVAEIEAKLGKP